MKAAERDIPDRSAAYGLLASGLIAMAPYVTRLPWWLSLFIGTLAGWRFLMLRRGWPVPNVWIRLLLVFGSSIVVLFHFGTVFGRDAGSGLLVTMLALKFLELRRLRDYMLALFLIYLLLAISFLYSQDLWLAIYLGAGLIFTSSTLIRIATPGISGYRSLRLAGRLMVHAIPLMVVIHLLFPRLQGALWTMPPESGAAITGLTDHMQPGSINRLSRSNEVAFRAYFADEIPQASERYWRAVVMSETDGRTWKRNRIAKNTPPEPPIGREVHYTLLLEPTGKPWVPALEYPSRWSAGAIWRNAATLAFESGLRQRRSVEMVSTPDQRISNTTRMEIDEASRLPTVTPRVAELAGQLAFGRSARETSDQILVFFNRSEFFYTLEPPLLGTDPVDEFLFETRRGFCGHYASAFVTLMRSAGIPARIVTGYQGGELNTTNRSIVVRQSDAHAWAEYWVGGEGWIRTDPTSAVAPERIELGAESLRGLVARGLRPGTSDAARYAPGWLARVRHSAWMAIDTAESAWQRWVISYGANRQRQLLEALGAGSMQGLQQLGVLAMIIALVFAAYIVATRPQRRAIDRVQRHYLRLCQQLARLGTDRAVHEGPVDFLTRARQAHPELAPVLLRLEELYVALRYGGASTEADMAEFVSAISGLGGPRG